MNYYVYIIKSSSTGKFYTGITNDIDRRLREHNRKKSNTIVTRNLIDFTLVYKEEAVNRIEARKREKYLKSGVGREFRNKILQVDLRV